MITARPRAVSSARPKDSQPRGVDVPLGKGKQRRRELPVEKEKRLLVDQESQPPADLAADPRSAQRSDRKQRAHRGQRYAHQISDRHNGGQATVWGQARRNLTRSMSGDRFGDRLPNALE